MQAVSNVRNLIAEFSRERNNKRFVRQLRKEIIKHKKKEANANELIMITLSMAMTGGSQQYRETILNYHTRQHYLSLNLMRLMVAIQNEQNESLSSAVKQVVGDFSYIPNSNSYCIPMIRLQISSSSVLMQREDFVKKYATIETKNKELEQKIKHCQALISQFGASKSLSDLGKLVNKTPDAVLPD